MAIQKDIIGQEVKIGDWAAITQHNRVFVGKIVKANNSITIAENRAQEFLVNNPKVFDKMSWQQRSDYWISTFGTDAIKKFGHWNSIPSWVRDGKFVKIEPTKEMMLQYENGREQTV